MLTELLFRVIVWIGYCWLLANWTNTLHGGKHPRKLLDKLLILHHLGMLFSPLILLGYVDAGVIRHNFNQSAWQIPTCPEELLVLAGYIGAIGFVLQVVRYQGQLLIAQGKVIQSEQVKYPINKYRTPNLQKQRWHYFPGNEVWQMEFNTKELYLERKFNLYEGLRILHLSDLHIIGFMNLEYYVDIMDKAVQSQPDLIVFSGDLLDYDDYHPWLESIFKPLAVKFPCYYVLGNHDWSKSTFATTRKIMQECGWHDLAGKVQLLTWQGLPVSLCGSELPWMNENPDSSKITPNSLSILLSHSPDQITWAAKRELALVLAGHTHGGQIVFPLVGPIYSPSIYGTQYASGIFKYRKTVIHVSRGIGGENPLRLNCPPEITLIIIKTAQS